MYDLMMWMIVIPLIVMVLRFWAILFVRVARTGLKARKILTRWMKRASAAFAEADREQP